MEEGRQIRETVCTRDLPASLKPQYEGCCLCSRLQGWGQTGLKQQACGSLTCRGQHNSRSQKRTLSRFSQTTSFPFLSMNTQTVVSAHTVGARRGSVLSCGCAGHVPAGSELGRSHSRAHNATPAPTVANTATAPRCWWERRKEHERSFPAFIFSNFLVGFVPSNKQKQQGAGWIMIWL